jgi:uncharacterized membrane protein YsdA (DUF1294 family)
MVLTVLLLLLPPMALLKGLRHWLCALHIAVMLVASWLKFPSLQYPLWHPYYSYFLVIVHLVSINLVTVLGYGWDKRQARYSQWRVPERTLHALAFMGGTLAAFGASKFFRHKTIKGQFRQMMWAVVVMQVMVVGGALWVSA